MSFSRRIVALRWSFLPLIVAASIGCGGSGGGDNQLPSATRTQLDAAVDKFLGDFDTPGVSVGVWVPGKGSYFNFAGYSNEQNNRKMTGNEHFRIGSITKTITVTAILQLADAKKLTLDDPISKYVAGVPKGDEITLRMLANMTSGLYSYSADDAWVNEIFTYPYREWKPQELLDVAFSHESPADPGEAWDYVNTNTVLLGLVVEKVSGLPVGAYFKKHIFEPLGMKNTFWPETNELPAPYAHGVTRQTVDGSRADATDRSPSWGFTAGEVISNMADLKIWVQSYTMGTLISPEMQAERTTWVTLPPNTPQKHYGLGMGEVNGWRGHTGELPGYNVAAYYLPDQKATVIVLVNSDIPLNKKNPAPILTEEITKIITPENVIIP
jgi:D-alanyl-D-alanine carboxypeptidase